MNKIIAVLFLVGFHLTVFGQIQPYHFLNTKFSTGINKHMQIEKNSVMYFGTIGPDYIIARELDKLKDGEVRYVANDVLTNSEKVILSLEDNDTNEQYRIELRDGKYFIVEEANSIEIDMGTYDADDEFIVERCGLTIIYRRNGIMKHYTLLVTNDFTMNGTVDINSVSSATAHIEFEQK